MSIPVYEVSPPEHRTNDELLKEWFALHPSYDNCLHTEAIVICKRTKINGSVHIVSQCVKCGREVRSYRKDAFSPEEIEAMPAFDEPKPAPSYSGQFREFAAKEYEEWKRNVWDVWKAEYLKSAFWARKRDLVLRRSRGVCECCGVEMASQVHHLHYETIGRERLWDLVAVCRSCHQDLSEAAGHC